MLLNTLRGGEHISLENLDELEQRGAMIRERAENEKYIADQLQQAKDLLKKD